MFFLAGTYHRAVKNFPNLLFGCDKKSVNEVKLRHQFASSGIQYYEIESDFTGEIASRRETDEYHLP